MSEKSRTAYGYTETDHGPLPHLRIAGVYGIDGHPIDAPIALVPLQRNSGYIPYPAMHQGMYVYALPGGIYITEDGKPLKVASARDLMPAT